MSYQGYRLRIGNTVVKNKWMAPESYRAVPHDRVVGTWEDGNKIKHREICGVWYEITFSLRERNDADQAEMSAILGSTENLSVTFWDDRTATYRTGNFSMTISDFNSKSDGGSLMYKPTQIRLTEY